MLKGFRDRYFDTQNRERYSTSGYQPRGHKIITLSWGDQYHNSGTKLVAHPDSFVLSLMEKKKSSESGSKMLPRTKFLHFAIFLISNENLATHFVLSIVSMTRRTISSPPSSKKASIH